MKKILLLICIIFPIQGIAQITMRIDYKNENKEIILFLKNETNNVFKFIPIEGSIYEYVSSISFSYKDKKGKILCNRERLIYDDQYSQQIRKGQFLAPYDENQYIHKLARWCQSDSIYTVDIHIMIDARIIGKKEGTNIIKTDGTYSTEIKKSFLWE